jgi:release factor glutamine methyltransferase
LTQEGAVVDALRAAAASLAAAGIDESRREARILLAHALGTDQAGLLRRGAGILAPDEATCFGQLIARRTARVPAAILLGHREFWSLDFLVTPDTLIPRPDSELIIEIAAAVHADHPVRHILDLGTGTGCLLLAALTECAGAWGLGVDLSPPAAALARRNAERLGLADRAAIMVGSWAEAITGRFDLLLCNPPYIPAADIAGLMPEVALHEPPLALAGGVDGLDPYRLLFPALHRQLAPGGTAVFEFGLGQAKALLDIARHAGLRVRGVRVDLAGHDRVMILRAS